MPSIFDTDVFNQKLFFPRTDHSPCPKGAVELHLRVEPHVVLHGRHHRSPGSFATLFLFHGNGEVVADYDDLASSFHSLGADIVVFDFRGYGLSEGTPTLRNTLKDAALAVQLALTELALSEDHRRIVFGRSLGSFSAAEVAGMVPALVDGVVLDSSLSDLDTMLGRRGMRAEGPFSDEEIRVFDPKTKLGRCKLPTLLVHGENDTLVHLREAQANFAALASDKKELVVLKERGHNDLFWDRGYWEALGRFVGAFR